MMDDQPEDVHGHLMPWLDRLLRGEACKEQPLDAAKAKARQ